MQVIDCRNFRELLDSYLSEELTVETNHSMLRHTEMCPGCRNEMSSRRQMRVVLKRACSRDQMSEQACDRLLMLLRAETSNTSSTPGWKERLSNFFTIRQALPVVIAVIVLISVTAGIAFWIDGVGDGDPTGSRLQPELALSAALFEEAIGDHKSCGLKFLTMSGPFEMPAAVAEYDPSYANLERFAAPGAEGLELRSAHLCGFNSRTFGHLIYVQNGHVISLLVTERDARAMDLNRIPVDEGSPAGLQSRQMESLTLGAYQTSRHVVLVVSDLSEEQNRQMTQRLAVPVAEHLRKIERQVAIQLGMPHFFDIGLTEIY